MKKHEIAMTLKDSPFFQVINENCPACFEGPKERHRVKKLLAQEENLFPGIFGKFDTPLTQV